MIFVLFFVPISLFFIIRNLIIKHITNKIKITFRTNYNYYFDKELNILQKKLFSLKYKCHSSCVVRPSN